MGEIALVAREEIIEERSDEEICAYWKAKADEMINKIGWGDDEKKTIGRKRMSMTMIR